MLKKIEYFVILIIILTSCSTPQERFEKQLDDAVSEKTEYTTFFNEGFSVDYPLWPKTKGNEEVSVTRGYCSVLVNSEKLGAKQRYSMFIESINENNGELIISNEEDFHIKYSLLYLNNSMVSDNKIFDCNGNAITISIVCLEQADKKVNDVKERIFSSASCEEDDSQTEIIQKTEETTYENFKDDDFSIEKPTWNELQDFPEQRVLGLTKGVCSLIVDKHNALPNDIFDWITTAIEEKNDQKIISSSQENDVHSIIYELPYENNTITATTKVFYCNYQSYITQVLCVNEVITKGFEEIRDNILESSKCLKRYEIPTPKKIEIQKVEVKEKEPEVIEEIEEEIVKTNVGEEFGIDEEMVVYFINSNSFFTKIMKDFPKANIVIEDKDQNRELKLKADIDSNGKIMLLDDGLHTNADVTLYVPLRDALNIFSNAQNINPVTLLGFALNVRTEPQEIKNQVIQKVLSGGYN